MARTTTAVRNRADGRLAAVRESTATGQRLAVMVIEEVVRR
jgi:hypothetical protein